MIWKKGEKGIVSLYLLTLILLTFLKSHSQINDSQSPMI